MSDSKTGSSTYNIDKLTETNYRSWAQQMQWILDEKDLWEVVNGKEVEPKAPTPPTDGVEFTKSVQEFTVKAKKARSTIGSSISASVMVYIEGMTDPVKIWSTLESKYNPKTKTTLLQAIREFMTVKMLEGDDLEKHLQRVQRLK
jgi:hypothetical protein